MRNTADIKKREQEKRNGRLFKNMNMDTILKSGSKDHFVPTAKRLKENEAYCWAEVFDPSEWLIFKNLHNGHWYAYSDMLDRCADTGLSIYEYNEKTVRDILNLYGAYKEAWNAGLEYVYFYWDD